MSFWYEPKFEDLEIDKDELNIYLGYDNNGSIYATVKIDDLKKIFNQQNNEEGNIQQKI
jgi:hypothetical protein